MSYCFNCGSVTDENKKFCTECGIKLIFPKKEEKIDEGVSEIEETYASEAEITENEECLICEETALENCEKTTQDQVFLEEKKEINYKKSILAMVFSALHLEFAATCIIPFFFILGLIPSLIFRRIGKKNYNEFIAEGGESNGFMKASHALRRGGLIVLICSLILGIIYTAYFSVIIYILVNYQGV